MTESNGTEFRTKYTRRNGSTDWPAIGRTAIAGFVALLAFGGIGVAQVKMDARQDHDIQSMREMVAEIKAARKDDSHNIAALLKYAYEIDNKLTGVKTTVDRLDRQ